MVRSGKKAKPRSRVSIIGAGRLGTALAVALASRSYEVQAVVSRQRNHARKAARLISSRSLALTADELDQLPPSNLILIATPDDAIKSVADKLSRARDQAGAKGTVLHTSGALSSEVLKPLAKIGFQIGSMHPLLSVSDPRSGAVALGHAYYCVEGDAAALRVARRIVKDLGGKSISIESDKKALYHAAAVMSSGHVTALLDVAIEMLRHCGVPNMTARRMLLPLLESTWKNLVDADPPRALTGTFARGDEETVRKHLAALSEPALDDARAAYRLLGKRSLELMARKGGDAAVIERIKQLLKG